MWQQSRAPRAPDAAQRPKSAFTCVFDALWRCATDPGPSHRSALGPGSASHHFVLRRVRDTMPCVRTQLSNSEDRQAFTFPQHERARVMHQCWPSIFRGRRECRVPTRTRALACKWVDKNTRKSSQVRRTVRHSLRDGLRLMARSPRGAGLDSPRHLAKRLGKA